MSELPNLVGGLRRLESGHWLGLLGVACLSASLYLVLGRGKQELGREVEESVQRGIQAGVDRALGPEQVEERGQAVGKGLVHGVLEGTLDEAARALSPSQRQERRGLARDAAQAGAASVEDLHAAVAEPGPEGEPAPAARLARVAGETAGDVVGLGFEFLGAALGQPDERAAAEPGSEPRLDDEGLGELAEDQ